MCVIYKTADVNQLVGSIPSELGMLTRLRSLMLGTYIQNTKEGFDPCHKRTHTTTSWVVYIVLSSLLLLLWITFVSIVSSSSSSSFSHVVGLYHIHHSTPDGNQLTGRIPSHVGLLTRMTHLRLGTEKNR